MRVGIIGAGHVGLPTAASLANAGHFVAVIDSDEEKLTQLGNGELPFFEPGLTELVRAEAQAGRLEFSNRPEEVISGRDVVFICVGTPPRASGEANLIAMERAAETIGRSATNDLVVVQKSTVPSGTASRLAEHLSRYAEDVNFSVVSNPEFLREGRAVEDSLNPLRILVGSDHPEAFSIMRALYEPFVERGARWIETDLATAELAKHASNAFLAMKISFANALARVCELAGGDVVAVADAIGSDPRIGRDFLDAGLGYGGYCLPKDVAAFDRLAGRLGYDFALLREIARVNDEAIGSVFDKIQNELWNLEDKRIAILGLAFKPGTDDVRLSPALHLAAMLIDAGAHVVGYDPQAGATAKQELSQLEIETDVYNALTGAHCAVVATDWPEFAALDLAKMKKGMAFPLVVDGRNIFSRNKMSEEGFTYLPTGRPPVRPRGDDRRGRHET